MFQPKSVCYPLGASTCSLCFTVSLRSGGRWIGKVPCIPPAACMATTSVYPHHGYITTVPAQQAACHLREFCAPRHPAPRPRVRYPPVDRGHLDKIFALSWDAGRTLDSNRWQPSARWLSSSLLLYSSRSSWRGTSPQATCRLPPPVLCTPQFCVFRQTPGSHCIPIVCQELYSPVLCMPPFFLYHPDSRYSPTPVDSTSSPPFTRAQCSCSSLYSTTCPCAAGSLPSTRPVDKGMLQDSAPSLYSS